MEERRSSDGLIHKIFERVEAIATNQAVIKEKVVNIEAQTIKTNGRVTVLEEWKSQKTGEFRIICWIVGALMVALVAAWARLIVGA